FTGALESLTVDGGGRGDRFSVTGTPAVVATVSEVQDGVVSGTAGNDNILLRAGPAAGEVEVRVNGAAVGTFRPTGRLVVLGLGSGQTVFNDAGSDTLTGSAGSDWLFAGSADKITGLTDADRAFIFGP